MFSSLLKAQVYLLQLTFGQGNYLINRIPVIRFHTTLIYLCRPVNSKGKCSAKFPVTPRAFSSTISHRNNVTLIVTAESKQLKGIMGTATISIVQ